MNELELRHVVGGEEVLEFWDMIKEVPTVTSTPVEIYGRCLAGDYGVLQGLEDGKTVVVLVYSMNGPGSIFVVTLNARKQVKKFGELLLDWCNTNGISRVQAVSFHGPEIMRNVIDICKKTTRSYYYQWEV